MKAKGIWATLSADERSAYSQHLHELRRAQPKAVTTRAEYERRFWAKVEHEPNSNCWLWVGARNTEGYGFFALEGNRLHLAHRVSYHWLVGDIPEAMTLDHLCRVRCCVNPAHLEPVPTRVNILRGESFSAKNARKTHCPRGHFYKMTTTQRYCPTCQAAAS